MSKNSSTSQSNITRRNSNETEWSSFDQSMESLLGEDSRRRRTTSSGPIQSPGSTHSDLQPRQIITPPPPSQQHPQGHGNIPVVVSGGESSSSCLPVRTPSTTKTKNEMCKFCSNPTKEGKCKDQDHKHLSAMFSCAACGEVNEAFEDIKNHIKDQHVGEDMELVYASIIVPKDLNLLKEFQCGIKSCERKFIGKTEEDLKTHIRSSHGEYYIHIFNGRNLIRSCRICNGKFSSDAALTDHITQWHPVTLFANAAAASEDDVDNVAHLEDIKVELTNNNVYDKKTIGSKTSVRMSTAHMDLERPSRKRKYSESIKDRLSMQLQSSTSPKKKINDNAKVDDKFDLKYKLQKIRESKIVQKKTYCEACCRSTKDWTNHKFGLEHIQNDKKARCHFCPKRFWYPDLKRHVAAEHKDCSFTCHVSKDCHVRLMNLDKMTEHINKKHRDQVEELIRQFGQNWESNFVSATHLGMNNFFLLPSDLRKLSCRLCGLKHLSQDQSALDDHFKREHPDLPMSQYSDSILFECRVCGGMLFGSETHLLNHFREVHSNAGLSSETSIRDLEGSDVNYPGSEDFCDVLDSDQDIDKSRQSSSRNNSLAIKYSYSNTPKDAKLEKAATKVKVRRMARRPLNMFSSTMGKSSKKSKNLIKKMYSDLLTPGNTSTDESSDVSDPVVTCNFCELKVNQSLLQGHLKKKHKNNLFACDGTCGKKFYSAWKNDVVSHLKNVHDLELSDTKLCDSFIKLPYNLTIISCKATECETEAIFLSREVTSVKKMLTRHAEKRHRGMKIEDCYNLGCRVCTFVWSFNDIQKWEEHCREHHDLDQRPDESMVFENKSLKNPSKHEDNDSKEAVKTVKVEMPIPTKQSGDEPTERKEEDKIGEGFPVSTPELKDDKK